jgi:hypothetical protein
MIKFHICCLVFLLMCGSFSAVARDWQDSSIETGQDTVVVFGQQPVPDSIFSFPQNIREVSEKRVSQYKNNPEYAYANDSEYWRRDSPEKPGLLLKILFSQELRWVFLTIVAGLILYGVYQLARENNFTMLIRTRKQKTDQTDKGLPGDTINFEKVIQFNQAEGNYRMAIRFLYLRLVYNLGAKSGISFRASSTNAEITRAMGTHPEAANFRQLATAYEYIFYGGFIPNQELYIVLKDKFEALQKVFSD